MKKINYLFTGILATAILFAGCSTQTKYTAFGGGWGMEKNKGFQTPNSTAKTATVTKNSVNSAEETITVNEVIAKKEANLSPEDKTIVDAHKAQFQKLGNKKLNTSELKSIERNFNQNSIAQKNLNNQAKVKTKVNSNSGDSDNETLIAILLCVFLGGLGIHRFYLGYTNIGIIQLLTGGGCGIWILIDLIRLITGDLKRKN